MILSEPNFLVESRRSPPPQAPGSRHLQRRPRGAPAAPAREAGSDMEPWCLLCGKVPTKARCKCRDEQYRRFNVEGKRHEEQTFNWTESGVVASLSVKSEKNLLGARSSCKWGAAALTGGAVVFSHSPTARQPGLPTMSTWSLSGELIRAEQPAHTEPGHRRSCLRVAGF